LCEDLGDVIHNGFDTYRHNLKISIPFLLYLLLIPVIIIPTAILLFTGEFEYKETIMPLWILILLLVLSLGFIFLAGAAGMARETTLEKRTSLRTMWIEGKAHWLQVLFAAVGFFVILTIGMFALLIPLFIIGDATGSVIIFLVFIPVMLIFLLFAMALGYIVPISIVVENLGAIEGIERGFGFIRSNKRDVLLISLLYLGASIAIELAVVIIIFVASAIFGFEDVIFSESEEYSDLLSLPANFIELVVLYPLFIVLWTRLYMGRTGKLGDMGIEMPPPDTPTDQKET